jgi:hypothetical protein
MYASWRELRDGFGKNAVALLGPAAGVLGVLAFVAALLPWLAVCLAAFVEDAARRPALIAVGVAGASVLVQVVVRAWQRQPLWPVALLPLGYLLAAVVLVRASIRAWRRQPVQWRGRQYPAA